MASAIFLFATAFALMATTAVDGSSNTVAITHRSTLAPPAYANDGQSVHIVKERPADEEYVTDFYRRVRDKRKAFFGRQLREHDALEQRRSEDHSLDHYFDHDLAAGPRHRASSKNGNEQKWNEAGAVKTSSCAVRSVRGGGTAEMARPSSHEPFHCSAAGRGGHGDRGRHREEDAWRGESGHPPRHHGRRGHHEGHARGVDGHRHGHRGHHHSQEHSLFDDDDDEGDLFDMQYDELDQQGGDDYPEHHLGLLRVPCSIAINSGEASGHYHPSSHASHPREHQGGSHGKTSMAAYVDTGAQVTVISAAAAKRAGIIHLMDRRYAGRATGVGHCRVLGRIPARHVYFILGEGDCEEDDDDYEDDFREEGSDKANTAQMDGPALTVLEGTVTQGVDILFGLDVLQDWEAEIRVGSRKSLTVKKGRNKNGGGGSAVIPFARPARRQHVEEKRTARPTRPAFVERRSHRRHHRPHPKNGDNSNHRRKAIAENVVDEEEDDDDFSPTSSDIESDLDLLDQTGHEFPEESYVDKRRYQEVEDELLSVREGEEDGGGDEYEDDDFDEEDEDDEGEMDMAGF